ncbi:MAG: hypothetical protein RJQ00_06470 [Vicingaceae bacterium]
MNQKVKIGIAVATGFLLGFALARISLTSFPETDDVIDKKSKKETQEPTEKKVVEQYKEVFPLKLGSTGEQVKRLQIFLMRQLGWIRQPNGEFDLIAQERTLKYFKKDHVDKELYEKLMLDKMVHDQRKKRA